LDICTILLFNWHSSNLERAATKTESKEEEEKEACSLKKAKGGKEDRCFKVNEEAENDKKIKKCWN